MFNKIYFGTVGSAALPAGSNGLVLERWDLVSNSSQIALLDPDSHHPNLLGENLQPPSLFSSIQYQVQTTYGKHLNKHYVVAVPESTLDASSWALGLRETLALGPQPPIHIGLCLPNEAEALKFWRDLQSTLDYPDNVSVSLYVNSALEITPWKRESVSSLIIPTAMLSGGVLTTSFLRELNSFCSQCRPAILLASSPDPVTNEHLKYMRALVKSFCLPKLKEIVLRDPLQPLRDDLTLDVYEVFERDRVKYTAYDGAISMALGKLRGKKERVRVLVIGPGRGPLLDLIHKNCSFNDQIVAVEKNPTCWDLLSFKNKTNWNLRVELIHSDIRNYTSSLFDLIISELLGSFACNELSPDILQQVSPHILNEGSIMIPELYTNYLKPIYSPILCQMVNKVDWNRPYIIDEHDYITLSKPLPVFQYNHPGDNNLEWVSNITNDIGEQMVHGFLGYFTSNLYGPYVISNNHLDNIDEYCSSWNPIFFPLKKECRTDCKTFQISRKRSETGVYYEWTFNGYTHNPNGANYVIGIQ